MSSYQYGRYEMERQSERSRERAARSNIKRGKDDVFNNITTTYRTYSRLCCNFVWPEYFYQSGEEGDKSSPQKIFNGRPKKTDFCDDKSTLDVKKCKSRSDVDDENDAEGVDIDEQGNEDFEGVKSIVLTEEIEKQEAFSTVDEFDTYPKKLREGLRIIYSNKEDWLSGEGLANYSPKFKRMIKNIESNEGKHLVYSHFRVAEGIELFRYALEVAGYKPFKINYNREKRIWDIGQEGVPLSLDFIANKHYVLHTGVESTEEKEILRNIYNGDMDKVPQPLRDKLLALYDLIDASNVEADQTEADQTEADQTEADQTEADQTEADQTEADQTEDDKTEAEDQDVGEVSESNENVDQLGGNRPSASKNARGNIIKVFMITSSGSEGITLKNTNFVHIMEPYWNAVRIEQVIGRIHRICSHEDLDAENKFVEAFLYMMAFTQMQKEKGMLKGDLLNKDKSKIFSKIPVSTDQMLYEIMMKKKAVSDQLLMAIKSSSMDCEIYKIDKANLGEGDEYVECFKFPEAAAGHEDEKIKKISYHPQYSKDEASSTRRNPNTKKMKRIKSRTATLKINGKDRKVAQSE